MFYESRRTLNNPERQLADKEEGFPAAWREKIALMAERLETASIQLESFRGLYPDEEIEKDLTRVRDMREKFSTRMESDASCARAYLCGVFAESLIHFSLSDPREALRPFQDRSSDKAFEVAGIRASSFDDIFNGIDEILHFRFSAGDAFLGLGVDATVADPRKKLQKLFRNAREGKKSVVKYFSGTLAGQAFRGELEVARVIIGAQLNRLKPILMHYCETGAFPSPQEGEFALLEYIWLKEIALQLEALEHVAPPHHREAFEKSRSIVRTLLLQRQGVKRAAERAYADDRVFQGIRTFCEEVIVGHPTK